MIRRIRPILPILSTLICTHYITDFGLQSEAMALGKAGQLPAPPGVPTRTDWLIAHAAINAAGVLMATKSARAALGEFIIHILIDWVKGEGWLSYRQDQALHLACKIIISIFSRKELTNEPTIHRQVDGEGLPVLPERWRE